MVQKLLLIVIKISKFDLKLMNLSNSGQLYISMILGLKKRKDSIADSDNVHRNDGSTFHSRRLVSGTFGLFFFELKARQV